LPVGTTILCVYIIERQDFEMYLVSWNNARSD